MKPRKSRTAALPVATSVLSSLVMLLCHVSADAGQAYAAAATGDSVRIALHERAGVPRMGEYVCFGVPIPRAWKVADVSRLRLRDRDGKSISAQFEALARWAGPPGDASRRVKWVLVGCLASVGAGGKQALTLDAAGPRWAYQAGCGRCKRDCPGRAGRREGHGS